MIQIGKYPSIMLKEEFSVFLKFKYSPEDVCKVKSLPVRKWVPDEKVWEVPISSLNRIVSTFGVENIQVFNDFPEYYDYLKFHEEHQKGKKSPEELKEYYKTLKPEVEFKFKSIPKGHQIEAFNKSLHTDNLFITDTMGLGKTASSLYIADYKKSIGLVKHCLIICGINSIKYNWLNEIKIHSWNNAQVIDGTAKKRKDNLLSYWQFYYNIINVELLRNESFVEDLENLINSGKIEMIIIDECHRLNNARSIQGGNLKYLKSKYKLALTGTPITKKIEKIWNILSWMDIIKESYWNFVKRYCNLGGFSGWEVISYKTEMLSELHEIMDRYQLRRTKDILDLPPKIYQTVYVEMSKSEKMEYAVLKEGIIKDIESGTTKYINPAAATIKLRQFTDKLKINAVKGIIDELQENSNSAVIFSTYKQGIYDLQESLKNYYPYTITGDEKDASARQGYVDKFQSNSKPEIMMGTIATLGTGYTLTKSNYVIFLNKDYVVGNNDQATDRCHRIGSVNTVTVISVIVKDSIDERVEEILENDAFYIDQVIDGIIRFKNETDVLSKLLEI